MKSFFQIRPSDDIDQTSVEVELVGNDRNHFIVNVGTKMGGDPRVICHSMKELADALQPIRGICEDYTKFFADIKKWLIDKGVDVGTPNLAQADLFDQN